MYDMYFNKMYSEDLGFKIIKRPSVPASIKQYTEIEIRGGDGKLYKKNNLQDIEFTVECNFINKETYDEDWHEQYRQIRSWINNIEDNQLIFDDIWDWYYEIKKVSIDSFDRIYKRMGKFNLKFLASPYMYKISNREILLQQNIFRNSASISKPTFRIVGNGICELSVNGNSVSCNVNGQLTIDTIWDKILEADGSYAIGKTNIKDMRKLYIQIGNNNITWTDGFKVYMKPNLRTI